MPHKKLGEILLEKGLITEAQLREAVKKQGKHHGRIGEILIATGIIREVDIVEVLCSQYNYPYATKENGLLAPRGDQRLHITVPYDFARKHFVLPIEKQGNTLTCAMFDPLDLLLIDNIKMMTGLDVNPYIATRSGLLAAIQEFYSGATSETLQKLTRPEGEIILKPVEQKVLRDEYIAAAKNYNIKFLRENPDLVKSALRAKNTNVTIEELLSLDEQRRTILVDIDQLRSQKNQGDTEIKHIVSQGMTREAQEKMEIIKHKMKQLSRRIDDLGPRLKELERRLYALLITIPNCAHESVPVGDASANEVVRTWGQPRDFGFTPRTHIEIAEMLDIIDFKQATKLSGSNFVLYKNEGARLERALYNFMLDVHATSGYREVFPPFLVNTASMTGTGQLPKMQEDMYYMPDDDLYLIPTAEVPVTNMLRDEMLKEEDLPLYYTAYTACFRREAGSYGKDTRGLVRVHQFNKVEMVKFVKPPTSYDELEDLVAQAEKILQALCLPYRVLQLATGDLSFAAAKCYDLEAYSMGMDRWLEVSSCSNFEDFQARRANIRYKGKEMKKPAFVHTLNGSGLALARTMIAILENYQLVDGSVVIPEVLRPYMGGMEKISKK